MEQRKPVFQIHVSSANVQNNRAYGENEYVCVIRLKDAPPEDLHKVLLCRSIQWTGGAKMVHDQRHPIPGTSGVVVAWIETDGDMLIKLDDHDVRRSQHNLGNEPYLKLTRQLFDLLKSDHHPPKGC